MSGLLLAVGIGCRSGVAAETVVTLIEKAISQIDGTFVGLFTVEAKQAEPALEEAARHLGLPLIFLPRSALAATADRAVTKSPRVQALFGVPSISETAALAGAGPGSHLVLARIAAGGVTCAIATGTATSKENP